MCHLTSLTLQPCELCVIPHSPHTTTRFLDKKTKVNLLNVHESGLNTRSDFKTQDLYAVSRWTSMDKMMLNVAL